MTYCVRILGSDLSSLRTKRNLPKQVTTPTTTWIRCLELSAPVDLPNVVTVPPWCSHQVAAGSLLSGLAFALLPCRITASSPARQGRHGHNPARSFLRDGAGSRLPFRWPRPRFCRSYLKPPSPSRWRVAPGPVPALKRPHLFLLCALALNRPRPRLSNSPLPRTHLIDPPD